MLVAGLLLGFVLGVAVAAGLWATGRRPYLRVDIEQHRTTAVVHHVIDRDPTLPAAPIVVDGRVVAPPVLPDPSRRRAVRAVTRTAKEIDK